MERVEVHKSVIHTIQLERGCSCSIVGSGANLPQFENLINAARRTVDDKLEVKEGAKYKPVVSPALKALRAIVDSVRTAGGGELQPELAENFYKVLTGYTQLIAQLMNDFDEWQSPNPDSDSSENLSFRRRSASIMAAQAFGHLKESYGFQRAFVCGVLALPDAHLSELPARAFADFVMCVSRLQAEQAAVCSAVPPSMLHMLSAGFELSPRLRAIQEVMLRDFDVVRAHHANAHARTGQQGRSARRLVTRRHTRARAASRAALHAPPPRTLTTQALACACACRWL